MLFRHRHIAYRYLKITLTRCSCGEVFLHVPVHFHIGLLKESKLDLVDNQNTFSQMIYDKFICRQKRHTHTLYMSLFCFTSSSGVATNSSLLFSRSAVSSIASSSSASFGSLPRTPPWLAWQKKYFTAVFNNDPLLV